MIGRPPGSYAAAPAREGFDVALPEAPKFPGRATCPPEFTRAYTLFRKYHAGESLIPFVRHYLSRKSWLRNKFRLVS